eukprot:30087-Pelagococcus_subviridis.AAC.15
MFDPLRRSKDPPVIEPCRGVTEDSDAGPSLETSKVTPPSDLCDGDSHTICFEDTNAAATGGLVPNLHSAVGVKFSPCTTTVVPPDRGPVGVTLSIDVGASAIVLTSLASVLSGVNTLFPSSSFTVMFPATTAAPPRPVAQRIVCSNEPGTQHRDRAIVVLHDRRQRGRDRVLVHHVCLCAAAKGVIVSQTDVKGNERRGVRRGVAPQLVVRDPLPVDRPDRAEPARDVVNLAEVRPTRGHRVPAKFGRTSGSVAPDAADASSNVTTPTSCAGTSQYMNADDTTCAVVLSVPNTHWTSSYKMWSPVTSTTPPPPLKPTSGNTTITSIATFISTMTPFPSTTPGGKYSKSAPFLATCTATNPG